MSLGSGGAVDAHAASEIQNQYHARDRFAPKLDTAHTQAVDPIPDFVVSYRWFETSFQILVTSNGSCPIMVAASGVTPY